MVKLCLRALGPKCGGSFPATGARQHCPGLYSEGWSGPFRLVSPALETPGPWIRVETWRSVLAILGLGQDTLATDTHLQ